MIIADIIFRFAVFWIKITLSCLFVLFLQVQVGEKSLEQWLEQGLKNSAFGRYIKQSAVDGVQVINQKVPVLKGIASNQVIKNNAVVEFHSALLRNLSESVNQFDEMRKNLSEQGLEKRLPSSDLQLPNLPSSDLQPPPLPSSDLQPKKAPSLPAAFPHLQKQVPPPKQ